MVNAFNAWATLIAWSVPMSMIGVRISFRKRIDDFLDCIVTLRVDRDLPTVVLTSRDVVANVGMGDQCRASVIASNVQFVVIEFSIQIWILQIHGACVGSSVVPEFDTHDLEEVVAIVR